MNSKQIKHIIEVQPFFWLLVVLVLFGALTAAENSIPGRGPEVLSEGWILNGNPVERLPEEDLRPAGEPTILSRTLDDRFSEIQCVCFYSIYEDVYVQLDGEIIYSFHSPKAESMVKAAPSQWNTVYLPQDSSGKTLSIELTCPYSAYSNRIGEIRYGTPQAITSYISKVTVPRFLMAVAILLIAIIFAFLAVHIRYYIGARTGVYTLSLTLMVLGIFLASGQTTILLNLYSGTSYIPVQCLSFMICPIMYTRYLMRAHTGFSRKISVGLHAVCIANMVIVVLLQLTHVCDMPEALMPTRVLCILIILYIFILELIRYRRLLILFFAVAITYGMIHYYRTGTVTWLVYPAIFVYVYILAYRIANTVMRGKLEEVRLRTELDVSRSELATVQITSHFFYHTLDAIRALIRIDSDKAYKMTGDFAKYLRYRVDGVERMEEQVSFSKELRSIRAYTDIKQAQLNGRLTMEFDIGCEDFTILPLTVQPLVENAVIHAAQKRRDGGIVRLVCREEKDSYHIEVIDNGTGNPVPETYTPDSKSSVAIHNVNTRLARYGIAPVQLKQNDIGGMTAYFDTPKLLIRKDPTP